MARWIPIALAAAIAGLVVILPAFMFQAPAREMSVSDAVYDLRSQVRVTRGDVRVATGIGILACGLAVSAMMRKVRQEPRAHQ